MIISTATFLLVAFLADSTASAASLLSSIASCCLPTFVADDTTFVDSPGILLVRDDDGCTPIRASCEKDKVERAADTTTISLETTAASFDGSSGFDEEEEEQQQRFFTNMTLFTPGSDSSTCSSILPAQGEPNTTTATSSMIVGEGEAVGVTDKYRDTSQNRRPNAAALDGNSTLQEFGLADKDEQEVSSKKLPLSTSTADSSNATTTDTFSHIRTTFTGLRWLAGVLVRAIFTFLQWLGGVLVYLTSAIFATLQWLGSPTSFKGRLQWLVEMLVSRIQTSFQEIERLVGVLVACIRATFTVFSRLVGGLLFMACFPRPPLERLHSFVATADTRSACDAVTILQHALWVFGVISVASLSMPGSRFASATVTWIHPVAMLLMRLRGVDTLLESFLTGRMPKPRSSILFYFGGERLDRVAGFVQLLAACTVILVGSLGLLKVENGADQLRLEVFNQLIVGLYLCGFEAGIKLIGAFRRWTLSRWVKRILEVVIQSVLLLLLSHCLLLVERVDGPSLVIGLSAFVLVVLLVLMHVNFTSIFVPLDTLPPAPSAPAGRPEEYKCEFVCSKVYI